MKVYLAFFLNLLIFYGKLHESWESSKRDGRTAHTDFGLCKVSQMLHELLKPYLLRPHGLLCPLWGGALELKNI
ncbi:hypothetical protein AOLI_G00134710 [Acnodon oligacanthus]